MNKEFKKSKYRHWTTKLALRSYLARYPAWKRGNLPVLDRMRIKTAQILLNMFKVRGCSVLSGFLLPAELLHVYGALPMFTEYLAPILAATGRGQKCLEVTESEGYSRDVCSFHRATLGACLLGYLPSLQLVVATSHLCDGQNKTLEELADRNGSTYFLLDVPQEKSPGAVDYLVSQLHRLAEILSRYTGCNPGPKDWQEVFARSNRTRQSMLRIAEYRKYPDYPLYGQEGFTLSLLSWLLMGSSFLEEAYLDLIQELQKNKPQARKSETQDRYSLLWLLSYPYYQGNFVWEMEEGLGLRAAADELSTVFWSPLDPDKPMESLAEKILSHPLLGPVDNRLDNIRRLVDYYQVDGVIHFSHFGCRQGCGGVRPILDTLEQRNTPFLELHGDCIDGRQAAQGQFKTRLQGFKEVLSKKNSKILPSCKKNGQLYLGIDIGSLSAKAVLLNDSREIVDQRIFLTGASSRQGLERLKKAFFLDQGRAKRIVSCISTGYGRMVVDFADSQVTEITCHAKGLAHQINGVHTIIDIGGQDTKAISIGDQGQVLKFLMNDKCAAGTGRFLEMMARTLELDLEDLGSMALQAKNCASISSLCTVFAESEVVSLISEETPVEEIALGVCQSIARRSVSMLDRVGVNKKVAMSGGVAKNQGVVRELEKLLGKNLYIPEEPQLTGALGAALIALEESETER